MKRDILIISDRNFIKNIQGFLFQLDYGIRIAVSMPEIKRESARRQVKLVIFDDDIYAPKTEHKKLKSIEIIRKAKKKFIIISSKKDTASVLSAKKSGASDYIIKPYNYNEFIQRLNAVIRNKKRISCIGGGTGLFNILKGLKTLPNVLLTSIVSTSDDGGSSGRLRESFGILPPGDIRRSLVALSNAPEIMLRLMGYRFKKGRSLTGHNVGNLILAALADIKGDSMSEAVRSLSDILNIQGIVVPVTSTKTILCARFEDGTVIKGENAIDLAQGRDAGLKLVKLWHKPEPRCDSNAFSAIINSDVIIIGPGDLFTSVITNILIRNIRDGILKTQALKLYICNLMTKPGETAGYDALDHIEEIIKYLKEDCLDYVIISDTKLSENIKKEYAKKGQYPVEFKRLNLIRSRVKAGILLADVGHEKELVRHDSFKIRNAVGSIIGV